MFQTVVTYSFWPYNQRVNADVPRSPTLQAQSFGEQALRQFLFR
jgi:hypothetical protein